MNKIIWKIYKNSDGWWYQYPTGTYIKISGALFRKHWDDIIFILWLLTFIGILGIVMLVVGGSYYSIRGG